MASWRGVRLRLPVRRGQLGRRASNAAAVLSLVGLIGAGLVTYGLIRNPIPLPARAQPTPIAGDTGTRYAGLSTIAPSQPLIGDSHVAIPGSVAYVRSGELFVQTGTTAVRITQSKAGSVASDPAWSPDGQWVYYVDTRQTHGWWYNADQGGIDYFLLTYPVLCRVHPDGLDAQAIMSGLIDYGRLQTFFWIHDPSISPDGTTAAVISDGPTDPTVSDNLLRFIDLRSGAFESTPDLPDEHPFGHSEPAYSPDGRRVAYVREGRKGNDGDPSIYLYDTADGTTSWLASGYRNPHWSPDGRYLAVTKSVGSRVDVAVIDASSGAEVGQVTSDGLSWAPVWSKAGDELVYMHLSGSVAGLRMVHIEASGGHLSFRGEPNLIDYGGLDAGSPVAWYIPATSSVAPSGPVPSVGPSAS
jgi:Tol biopolymer transport system component